MPRRYQINEDNTVQVIEATAAEPANLSSAFSSVEGLQEVVGEWPLRRLVEVWNRLPNVRPLSRFEDRQIAVQRIWRRLTNAERQAASNVALRRRRPARQTKTELVLQMLRRPEGTTLQALMKATQWQAHSVRGFLSRKVAKSLGLDLVSTKRKGERVYALAPPDVRTAD